MTDVAVAGVCQLYASVATLPVVACVVATVVLLQSWDASGSHLPNESTTLPSRPTEGRTEVLARLYYTQMMTFLTTATAFMQWRFLSSVLTVLVSLFKNHNIMYTNMYYFLLYSMTIFSN